MSKSAGFEISNEERSLLGLPPLVRIVACCSGSMQCEYPNLAGKIAELLRRCRPSDGFSRGKKYLIRFLDGKQEEHFVYEIELLP